MKITIDLDLIVKLARQSQEHPQDVSFPFYAGFHEAYPQAGDYLCNELMRSKDDPILYK